MCYMESVRDYPQMKIRLSPDLKALIEESAKSNNRTLNAEINARLEQALKLESSSNCVTEERLREVIREELAKAHKS